MVLMKLLHSVRFVLAGAVIALISACATTPSGPAALAGTWTNSFGTVWTINADGTFHVMTMKPKAEIWGNYTLAGDTITVQETRHVGRTPKSCHGAGVYKFSRPDGNTLAFVLVSDKCKPRIQNVTQPWHPK
jgi:streptogramin lyase